MPTYQGACFCGAITIEATGAPFVMGYCHCRSCRSWSAGPVNALTLWRENEVRVTGGGEHSPASPGRTAAIASSAGSAGAM
jgi:hypothetical protein